MFHNNSTTSSAGAGDRPTVMVTNDDGIDAAGLRALVRVLVSSNRFHVLVCAPDSEKSAVSHCITWRNAISAKPVGIDGAIAFAVSGTPADCTSLGISKALFSAVSKGGAVFIPPRVFGYLCDQNSQSQTNRQQKVDSAPQSLHPAKPTGHNLHSQRDQTQHQGIQNQTQRTGADSAVV